MRVSFADNFSQFNAEIDEASDLSFATFVIALDFGTFPVDEIFPIGAVEHDVFNLYDENLTVLRLPFLYFLLGKLGLIDGYFP